MRLTPPAGAAILSRGSTRPAAPVPVLPLHGAGVRWLNSRFKLTA